jgi:putative transposase
MPRRKIEYQSDFPYHVFNRCLDQKFFQLPMPVVWDIVREKSYQVSIMWNARIHALVLMSNHYHMVLSTPDANLGVIMQDFQSEVALSLSHKLGKHSYRFQARYKATIIKEPSHFEIVMRYVYQNPVSAGICSRVEDYPYSSLWGQLYGEQGILLWPSCLSPEMHTRHPEEWLGFYNREQEHKDRAVLTRGLRHSEFRIALGRSTAESRQAMHKKC